VLVIDNKPTDIRNKMESIMGVGKRKLAAGTKWRFFGSHKGHKYYSKAIYDTKAEALAAERDFLVELASGVAGTGLKQLTKERLKDMEVLGRSDKYIGANERYFKIMIEEWGNVAVTNIKKAQVKTLLNKEAERLRRTGKTLHKANEMLRCIKAFFQWCIDIHDIQMANPVKGLPLFPIEINLKYIPQEGDLFFVKAAINEEQEFLVDFVDQTACRIDEALRFRVEDINGDVIVLWTRKAKNSNLTPRQIPKPEVLDRMRLPMEGRVFKAWDTYPKFLTLTTQKLAAEGTLVRPFSWHHLRHRRCSIWANEGMTIWELMARMGHSNISTTQRYVQLLGFRGTERNVFRSVTYKSWEEEKAHLEFEPGRVLGRNNPNRQKN
jgi:integrase